LLLPLWCSGKATDTALSVLPNLLGFSVGAVAIVLAFPSSKLLDVVSNGGSGNSYYMDTASRFVHFVIVQVVAVIIALFAKSYPNSYINFIACLLFIYALLTAVAAGLSLFGIAKIYNASGTDTAP
jgi:protein-S-isoprenylcysteine O-methyltransferase Ste14